METKMISNKQSGGRITGLLQDASFLFRRCLFRILCMGPIPNHIAFIMDGNRRFAKKEKLEDGVGHRAGFSALMSILNYCYELGVRYVTVYAFSIENFKRKPEEVQGLMDLMLEKIQGLLDEECVVNQYGIRVYFVGNLKLLSKPVRIAAEKVMRATANNTKCALLVCVAYTSCDEIVHAIAESCRVKRREERQQFNSRKFCNGHWIADVGDCSRKIEGIFLHGVGESCRYEADESPMVKLGVNCNGVAKVKRMDFTSDTVEHATGGPSVDWGNEDQEFEDSETGNDAISAEDSERNPEKYSIIKMVDIEKHMYMAVAPAPDILIRSSGENRLSNFLLWQTVDCPLYSPKALWPEIGLWHLVWAVLIFQRNYPYLEKKKKQS